jgi:hypothetical protein
MAVMTMAVMINDLKYRPKNPQKNLNQNQSYQNHHQMMTLIGVIMGHSSNEKASEPLSINLVFVD